LEDRLVLSAGAIAPPALGPALMAPPLASLQQVAPVQMLPLHINNVALQANQLIAHGMLGSHALTLPLTLSAQPNPADPSCPILHLAIPQGIHLNVLGLKVDTSGICLRINGDSGPGNLLGNLVCGLAHALDTGGVGLTGFLNGLSASHRSTLLGGLRSMLNSSLIDAVSADPTGPGARPSVIGPSANILHLSLGPVNLNLLGLVVHLDNCKGGPITVNITAVAGAGNLLGNLLFDLSYLLNHHASVPVVENTLHLVAGAIDGLL
jgi:hypothetical protein